MANPAIGLSIGYDTSDFPYIQAVNSGVTLPTNLKINPYGGDTEFGGQVTVPTPSADGSAVNKAYVTSLFTYDCTPTPVIPVAGVTLIYRCGVNTGVNP
jgi:hypothetical protein